MTASGRSVSAYDAAAFSVDLDANTKGPELERHRQWLEEQEAALNAVSHQITDYFPDIEAAAKWTAHWRPAIAAETVCDGHLLFDAVTASHSVFRMHSASSPRTLCHFKIFEDDEVRQCLSSRSIWILHESLGRDLYEYLVTAMGAQSDGDRPDHGPDDTQRDRWQQRFDDEATSTVLSYDQLSLLFDGEGHQFQALTSFQRRGFRSLPARSLPL